MVLFILFRMIFFTLQLQSQITHYYFLSMSNLDGIDNLIDLKRDPFLAFLRTFLSFFTSIFHFRISSSSSLAVSPSGPGVAASRLISPLPETNETKASLIRKKRNDGDSNRRPLALWVVNNPTRPRRPTRGIKITIIQQSWNQSWSSSSLQHSKKGLVYTQLKNDLGCQKNILFLLSNLAERTSYKCNSFFTAL